MLLSALVAEWRGSGRTVAVLAVDPSSKRSGGSLLGDRARIDHDPSDDGILIRSTAAGGRLGGLAAATREAADALAAAFDVVVVETVGVGQSETDVEEVCDTVAVVVQPAAGDVLQFLKAGIMEVPDVLVVTKADLGDPALRTRRDLEQALAALGSRGVPVVAVSSLSPPRGSRSWPAPSTATAATSTWPGVAYAPVACPPCASSWPSTAKAPCAAWAAAARRTACSQSRIRARRWESSSGRSRSAREPAQAIAGRSTGGATWRPARSQARFPSGAPGLATIDGRRRSPARQIAADTGVLIAVLAVVTGVAELAGAANLGVSLGIGTIAFTIVLMYLMLRR